MCSFSHHTLLRFKLMCIITITSVQYITQETQETYLEQKKPFIMIKWIKWIDADLCGALGNAGKWNFNRVRWGYNSKLKTFLVRWMLIKITCSKHLTLQSIPAWHRGKSFATTTLCMVKIKIEQRGRLNVWKYKEIIRRTFGCSVNNTDLIPDFNLTSGAFRKGSRD